jgi:hypothetical protein
LGAALGQQNWERSQGGFGLGSDDEDDDDDVLESHCLIGRGEPNPSQYIYTEDLQSERWALGTGVRLKAEGQC